MIPGCAAGSASAHFFTQPYTLPVPFSLYAFGAASALLLSFVVIGLFARLSTIPGRFDVPRGKSTSEPIQLRLLRFPFSGT